MDVLTAQEVKGLFGHLGQLMNAQKDFLTEMDSAMGDGDLGLTMSRGFSAVAAEIPEVQEEDPGKLLAKGGMIIAKAVPSTMGTLMGTGFMKGGMAVQNKGPLGAAEIAQFFTAFVEGIMARGKSEPGQRTVIDSLYPAAETMRKAAEDGKDLKQTLADGLEGAKKGLEATKEMLPQHGKAAIYREKLLGKQDQGATVGMLIVQGFAEFVQ